MMGADPRATYERLMASNPQFAAFVRDNQGKSPEQIAREHGIDYDMVRKLMR